MSTNFSHQEPARLAELRRMKRMATGLLALVSLVYLGSAFYEHSHTWAGYINATFEAAMVGAVADWFAVTALFRHPMGLRIPHTAIIPTRKNEIAAQFGAFVQRNFLSDDVIKAKFKSTGLSRRVAGWISQEENARTVAEQVTAGLAGVVRAMNDDEIQKMIQQKIETKVRATSFAPVIGELLSFITSGKRQQDLIDGAVNISLHLLENSDRDIRNKVAKETPWWFPDSVDQAIYHRIVQSVSRMLYGMQEDTCHPLRLRLINLANRFLEELKHSDDIAEKEAALKDDFLTEPAVSDFITSLWIDIKEALQRQSEHPDEEWKQAIRRSVMRFGESILEDPVLASKIDTWAEDSARYLINTYGHEAASIVSDTIKGWDPTATSQRIEAQIGKDLQFIRINGTLVGGLVGLAVHTLRDFAGYIIPV